MGFFSLAGASLAATSAMIFLLVLNRLSPIGRRELLRKFVSIERRLKAYCKGARSIIPASSILQSIPFSGGSVKVLRTPWVRIASSVLSASNLFPFNKLIAESTLEAMRTQAHFRLPIDTRLVRLYSLPIEKREGIITQASTKGVWNAERIEDGAAGAAEQIGEGAGT